MTTDDELLTASEVAHRLKVHPETVRQWVRDGRLRAIRFGNGPRASLRIRASEVERFLNGDQGRGEAAAA